jgi:hypothetical protein
MEQPWVSKKMAYRGNTNQCLHYSHEILAGTTDNNAETTVTMFDVRMYLLQLEQYKDD